LTSDPEVLKRLDLIQATLALAFSDQLRVARDAIRADAISAAILDRCDDWIGSTALQDAVAKAVGKTPRSVRDRFPELVAQRVLEVRGTEKRQEFRRTGLV
jgi:hypothetical protein